MPLSRLPLRPDAFSTTRRPHSLLLRLVMMTSFVVMAMGVSSVCAASLQPSPWEHAVSVLRLSFTGPIARGLSLVAIVIGGLMFAFSEGSSKQLLAGIIFGVGMAIGATNFMAWLFP